MKLKGTQFSQQTKSLSQIAQQHFPTKLQPAENQLIQKNGWKDLNLKELKVSFQIHIGVSQKKKHELFER